PPSRAAFALEAARIPAKKVLWQLDPYAANKEYTAPGGTAREAALLAQMAASFITPQALPDYETGPLAAYQNKIHPLAFPCLIPPGDALREPATPEPGTLRCVFCGNLHPEIRSPAFALSLFAALPLPTTTLVMAGGGWEGFMAEAQAAQKAMGNRLTVLGPVPPARARALLAGADVLVSLGNSVDNQMPSKIFEYFGLGKPVLHLAATDADPVLPVLQRYPLGFILRQEDGASALAVAALQGWLTRVAGQQLPFAQVAALYPEYTPAAVADKFLDALL
ncbi:MAG: glycosyltransferase, partial [Gemmiger sp.]|nr:glycosyltransferase [Gemmiger sp.]